MVSYAMVRFYKYVGIESAKIIIKDATLKFTNPIDFNDPFDYHPTVDAKEFNKFIKRINNEIGDGIKRYKTSHSQLKIHLQELRSSKFREMYTKNMSVSCFSKSPFILPMWAHYANNHEGCVIEFEYKNEAKFFSEYFSLGIGDLSKILVPFDVNYSKERPRLFDEHGRTNSHNTGFYACLTKAKEWEYEQEMRVVTMQPQGIYPFERSQITGVYFGMQIDRNHKKEISRIIDSSNNHTGTNIKKHDVWMAYDKFDLSRLPFRL
ncbi:DUF2971 domain-containing protein [Serratia liquefaciens]|uniref:DUF2971 domain-containing protein n=1 Tax=Serratia liquefaciens TaxID=614 RepID=UPI0022B989F7|nr:DUF2971 domain-containing protein [Serratia liquefaciens]